MSDGRCDHCEIDFAQLPGWRHIVRERPDGSTEHLWLAHYEELGTRFACGVSVVRHPIDKVIANGRPLIIWKMVPRAEDISDAQASGSANSVRFAVSLMIEPTLDNDTPRILRWAQSIQKERARRAQAAKDALEPAKPKPAPEVLPVPF